MTHTFIPPKVVVIGGGTGTFPVVMALKILKADITSLIAVSDSGGSTGRIRDEFGFPPVGDLRQALAALADAEGQEWIRKILLYRFDKGEGLKGHNLGNLILTALQDMTGDTTQALEIVEKVFRIDGRVIPVTNANVNLLIHYTDGSQAVGEHILDENPSQPKKITNVTLTPTAPLNPEAADAITEADYIIIGPGDYYASVMAALAPDGMIQAFAQSRAKVVYMMNLMTRFTQTHQMSASAHLAGIEQAIGKQVDIVVLNNQPIPDATLKLYAASHEFPVVDDLVSDPRVRRVALLSDELVKPVAFDTAHRSFLRHDQSKVQQVLADLL